MSPVREPGDAAKGDRDDKRVLFFANFLRNAMIFSGMWFLDTSNATLSNCYKFYSYFIHVFYTILVGTLYLIIPFLLTYYPGKMLDQAVIIILYSTSVVKLYIIMTGKVRLFVIDIIAKDKKGIIKEEFSDVVKNIFYKYTRLNDQLFKLLTVTLVTTSSVYFLNFFIYSLLLWDASDLPVRNITEERPSDDIMMERPLIYMSWTPFDKSGHYYWASGLNIFVFVFAVAIIVTADGVVLTLILHCLCELKVVKYNFRYYDSKEVSKHVTKGRSDGGGDFYENVSWCIEQHQRVIKDVENLDKSIQTLMLLDFLTHSLQLATTLMLLLILPISIKFLWACLYFTYVFFQLCFFYWYSNEIQLESMDISSAIYESNWYLHDTRVQKSLLLVMLRAQRSLKLHIGPLYDVSNEILVKILRTFYTLVSVMQNFSN